MIIHETAKRLNLFFVFVAILLAVPASAQNLQPAPTFHLLNTGYGARALGIGGAFQAVADDLSTIYWNPAGLVQLEGIQVHVDYRTQGDSDEDFASETGPNSFFSQQRYSVKGNQFQAFSFSYAFPGEKYAFVPAFAWHRLSTIGPKRDLKDTAGMVQFLDPQRLVFVQSEGLYREEFKGGENEYSFGLGFRISPKVMIGGSWSFLAGGIDQRLTGDFHDSFIPGSGQPAIREDIALQQSRKDDLSGNYLRLGVLFAPSPVWKLAGYIRLPYTRKSDISLERTGTVVSEGIATPLNESATATSEVDVPTEWGGAVAIRTSTKTLIAGSITYAGWEDAVLLTQNSSDPALLAENALPYPTLRADAGLQYSLLQLRAGVEYQSGGPQGGLALRAGIFRDGQPYANQSGDRVSFKGYTFGAGYSARGYRLDVAWVRETGDITFSSFSQDPSTFTNQRWVFSLDFIGR